MVLESIINPANAENRPKILVFIGFVYVSLAMFLSYMIFEEYSSLFMVFLATIASIPLIYRIIKLEEEKDLTDVSEVFLLKEHWKALSAFMYLFLGAVLSFVFWYSVLPSSTISTLFESQTSTILSINGRYALDENNPEITGKVITGEATSFGIFSKIFFNNIKVLLFCILFSFLYGAGAIFILLWNASVIGAAIGMFIRNSLSEIFLITGNLTVADYFSVVSIGLTKYIIHGFPEILAYFVGALAGGIISIAVVNHDFSTRKFEHILVDAADLLMLSIFLIFLAALLEVYVTPLIF